MSGEDVVLNQLPVKNLQLEEEEEEVLREEAKKEALKHED